MEAADLLAKLRPPHAPLMPTVAAGESVAAAIFLGCMAGILVVMIWRLLTRKPSARSEALKALEAAKKLSAKDQPTAVAATLRKLMERVDGFEAGNLRDEAWLKRLDEWLDTDFFSKGGGNLLGDKLYMPMTEDAGKELQPTVRSLVARRIFWWRKR